MEEYDGDIEHCSNDFQICQVLLRNLKSCDINKFFTTSCDSYKKIENIISKTLITFPLDVIKCVMDFDVVNVLISSDFWNSSCFHNFGHYHHTPDITFHFVSSMSNIDASLEEFKNYEISHLFQVDTHYHCEKYFGTFKNGLYFYILHNRHYSGKLHFSEHVMIFLDVSHDKLCKLFQDYVSEWNLRNLRFL